MSVKHTDLNADGADVNVTIRALAPNDEGGTLMGGDVSSALVAWAPDGTSACEDAKAFAYGNMHALAHLLSAIFATLLRKLGPDRFMDLVRTCIEEAAALLIEERKRGKPDHRILPGDEWKYQ